MPNRIFHITTAQDWQTAQARGRIEADSLRTQGFIHCATEKQLPGVLQRFFANARDLLILEIDSTKLKAPLKYEDTEGHGDLFPHVYGPIHLDAVIRTLPRLA